MPRKDPKDPVLATNRKAFHDYNVLERFEAGIQLVGAENNQALLYNVHIAGYDFGNRFNHNTKQTRRLLLHKKEILKLAQWVNTKGGTIIPLKFYLTNGLVKVEIAYCQGKTHADQRETLRKRETEREMQRFVRK